MIGLNCLSDIQVGKQSRMRNIFESYHILMIFRGLSLNEITQECGRTGDRTIGSKVRGMKHHSGRLEESQRVWCSVGQVKACCKVEEINCIKYYCKVLLSSPRPVVCSQCSILSVHNSDHLCTQKSVRTKCATDNS